MSKRNVIVELSPTQVRVALVHRAELQGAQAERVALNLAEDLENSLQQAVPIIKRMTEALGARGAAATVLYGSSTAAVGVFSCVKSAGQTRAIEAAALALGESADYPLAANCSAVAIIGADPATAESQSHVLAIADTDSTVSSIARAVAAAGLVPEAVVPSDAPQFAEAVHRALELSTLDAPSAVLYIGEHSSILAAACGGRLKFARSTALGAALLVEALTREIRSADGTPVALSAVQAREIVERIGIPTRDQVVLESPRILGDAVLPLLQPVVQRWVVEIRQSLRFGLEEGDRAAAKLEPLGPAAALPRLAKVISDQLSIRIRESNATVTADTGLTESWLRTRPRVGLVPRAEAEGRASRGFRRALIVGASAACLVLGLDAMVSRAEYTKRSADLAQCKSRLAEAQSLVTLRNEVAAEQAALAQAKGRMRAKLGQSPSWDAALAMLASKTPAGIKLSDVQLTLDNGQPLVKLVGRMPAPVTTDSKGALKGYMDDLSSVPLVRSCKLGATQRGESDSGPILAFEMSLTLVSFMPDAVPGAPSFTAVGTQENP